MSEYKDIDQFEEKMENLYKRYMGGQIEDSAWLNEYIQICCHHTPMTEEDFDDLRVELSQK